MATKVTRVENEPIILATLSGKIGVDDVVEMFRQSEPLLEQIEGDVYRITDVSDISSSFGEIMNGIRHAAGGKKGTTSDPRIHVVLVGDNKWVQLYRSAMFLKEFGRKEIPIFATVEEAMNYVRRNIEKSKNA